MSVPLDTSSLTQQQKYKLISDLTIKPKETKFNKNPKGLTMFEYSNNFDKKCDENEILIPFSYAFHHSLRSNKHKPTVGNTYKFVGKLNVRQKECMGEIFSILNYQQSIIIALATGYGKTIAAIYIASKLAALSSTMPETNNHPNKVIETTKSSQSHMATCVVVNRLNLIDQWKLSIRKTCPEARIQVLTSKTVIDKKIDFYIINISTISKRSINDFKYIKLLIVDEAHLICSVEYSKALFYFKPEYMIALTATPTRDDNMHYLLEDYFGPFIVHRPLWYPCNVYYIETGFKPTVESGTVGLDWNKCIKSQSECEYRNDLIVKIIRYFKHRTFIVMCKRKSQCDYLYNALVAELVSDFVNSEPKATTEEIKKVRNSIDIFTGTKLEYDNNCRVLISTYSKTGVGFDFAKVDSLICASDVEAQILQYYGRIFRRDNVMPAVFDLRDKNFIMEKHWKTRSEMYVKHGGICKDFKKCFPEFFTFWKTRVEYAKVVFE